MYLCPLSVFQFQLLNPYAPKFKKYILPTFKQKMYKWGSENW